MTFLFFSMGVFFVKDGRTDAVGFVVGLVLKGLLPLDDIRQPLFTPSPDARGLNESTKTPKNARLHGRQNKVRKEIHPGVYLEDMKNSKPGREETKL